MTSGSTSDTIAAVATAAGPAGVGVVRLSGPAAVAVARRLMPRRRRLPHRHLVLSDLRGEDGRVLDQGFVCAMYGPRSFTGEDVVELHVHGGVRNLARVLAETLRAGARLAEPGEFTRRAVLNGRIDLTRAEALRDVVNAATDAALDLAHAQRAGAVSAAVTALVRRLEDVLVRVEADLDFPEEEGTALDPAIVVTAAATLGGAVRSLAATWETGRRLRHGWRVVVAGAPNVGKSTLFNALLGSERAIVTATPGTTRDFLEETVELEGLPVVLVDTAGRRDAACPAEREGVARAERLAAEADLVLALVDGSAPFGPADRAWLAAAEAVRTLVVLTKADLPPRTTPADLPAAFRGRGCVTVSAASGVGLADLRARLRERGLPEGLPAVLRAVVSDLRHRQALDRAAVALDGAAAALRAGLPLELAAADLHAARRALGEIVGAYPTEDLLRRIFAEFCIGK
jgi:tRNA modification GTPase